MYWYLDTSAFMKLVVEETASKRMRTWHTSQWGHMVSSELMRVEALRTARKLEVGFLGPTRQALRTVHLVAVSRSVCDMAAELGLEEIRSLDALHLASALLLGDELAGIVTYDERLTVAARSAGLEVIQP